MPQGRPAVVLVQKHEEILRRYSHSCHDTMMRIRRVRRRYSKNRGEGAHVTTTTKRLPSRVPEVDRWYYSSSMLGETLPVCGTYTSELESSQSISFYGKKCTLSASVVPLTLLPRELMPDIITSTRCVCRGIPATTRRDPWCTQSYAEKRSLMYGVDHLVKAFIDQEKGFEQVCFSVQGMLPFVRHIDSSR